MFAKARGGIDVTGKLLKKRPPAVGHRLNFFLTEAISMYDRGLLEGTEDLVNGIDFLREIVEPMDKKNPKVSDDNVTTWLLRYVEPEMLDSKRDEKMKEALTLKFKKGSIYADLLLSTGERELHENADRFGVPPVWVWRKRELSPEQKQLGYTRGGDLMGKLLCEIRDSLR